MDGSEHAKSDRIDCRYSEYCRTKSIFLSPTDPICPQNPFLYKGGHDAPCHETCTCRLCSPAYASKLVSESSYDSVTGRSGLGLQSAERYRSSCTFWI